MLRAIANPLGWLLAGVLFALALQLSRRRDFARRLLLGVAAFLAAVAILPIGHLALAILEQRFAGAVEPERVDGVIVLGGGFQLSLTAIRGQPTLNDAADRLVAFVDLARRHPKARLAYAAQARSAGSAAADEAEAARRLFAQIGFDDRRVVYDSRSGNTWQNALFLKRAVKPAPGEVWLLVTSAAHMPRAVGAFRGAGWPVVAYPVDYRTSGYPPLYLTFDMVNGLAGVELAAHEFIGLLVYRLLGRTDAFFPAP